MFLPDAQRPFFVHFSEVIPLLKTIQTVSGHIGSGKSRSFHEWYAGRQIPIVLATPTNTLSHQHHAYFSTEGVVSAVISQDEGYRSAKEEFDRRMTEGYDGIPIVNHTVALTVDTDVANHVLVLDEIPSPVNTIYIEFENASDVADFSVIEADIPGYYKLVSSAHAISLVNDAQDREGTKYTIFGTKARELGEKILNDHYQVVIDKESFDNAASGKSFRLKADGTAPRVFLQFTIFMLPSIVDQYKATIMIGANQEKTLLARMWSKDVKFETNHDIQRRLDYDDLSHKANLAKIYYPPIPNLSKTFLKRLGSNNEEAGQQLFLDTVADGISELFSGKRHIFCTNKHSHSNREYRWKLEGKTGKRVITNPHGWNDLQDYDMAVFMAAINYDPETERRLSDFYGISRKQAKEALAYELVYQFLGRTSLRSKDSQNEVILVVPDEGAARCIQAIIGCAEPTPLPIEFGIEGRKTGRPRVEKSIEQKQAENRLRVARHREKQKAASAAQLSL